jgi:flagellar basal body rod protein FlgB
LRSAIAAQDCATISKVEPSITVDAKAVSGSRDGNTVRLEDELLQLSQNTMQHAFEVQVISGAMLKLRMAITGKA